MNKKLIPLALACVGDEKPIDGRTRLQKMVFMIQQQLVETNSIDEDQLYEFFAYDYGPFSKELAEDIDEMIEEGIIDENDIEYGKEGEVKYLYKIKPHGKSQFRKGMTAGKADQIINLAEEIKQRYNEELSLPEVIDEVYSEYPDFAEKSVY